MIRWEKTVIFYADENDLLERAKLMLSKAPQQGREHAPVLSRKGRQLGPHVLGAEIQVGWLFDSGKLRKFYSEDSTSLSEWNKKWCNNESTKNGFLKFEIKGEELNGSRNWKSYDQDSMVVNFPEKTEDLVQQVLLTYPTARSNLLSQNYMGYQCLEHTAFLFLSLKESSFSSINC